MTYDFYADKKDKTEVLDFIFQHTDLQVFDLASEFGQKITRYKNTEDILSKFDFTNGGKYSVTFQLWSPRFKGDLVFSKIKLDPKYCDGHKFRYDTEGWGLIQLYFGGIKNEELSLSHIGHQSQKRALAWQSLYPKLGKVNKWDWTEVQKTSRALKNQIHTKMAVSKKGSQGVLKEADKLEKKGIKLI